METPFLVKICGLTTAGTLDAALGAGANLVGFVHFPPSPRHLDLGAMAALAERARGRAGIVVLLVSPEDALVDAVTAAVAPDYLQLHGRETPERAAALRARGAPVIKALGIGSAADVAAARAFDGTVDLLLLDAKPPKEATRPGGLGAVFDWSLLDGAGFRTPVLLSGGLGPTNVGEAIARVAPAGVDVSSGVESAPGVKDAGLIAEFVAAARRAAGRPHPREDDVTDVR